MTYSELIILLQGYLERGDVTDPTVYNSLNSLVNIAERDIAKKLKIQGFLEVVTFTLKSGVSVYAKPDRWRSTVSINFGIGTSQKRTPIFPRGYEYCRAYWPDEDLTGQPEFYADYNQQNWLIVPTPDVDYPTELLYYSMLPLLSPTNQTNWLSDVSSNALLYGTLLHLAPFLKEDDRVGLWKGFFDDALASIDRQDLEKILDRTSTRQKA